MNRKQIIEKLKAFKLNNAKTPLEEALQYAIDHLSREWVSRSHHRKFIKKLYSEYSELADKHFALESDNETLKADKDRLQTAYNNKFEEVEMWTKNSIKLESDWEKESDKVSELKTHRLWLSISTIALLITLLISLFAR